MAREHRMIEPFSDRQIREGVISYGVSSYGYDVRIASDFKIFTNINSTIVDPKNFDPRSFVDFEGDVCVIPPNSFALARTVEFFRIPRNVLVVCLGKCLAADTTVVDGTGAVGPLAERMDREGSLATLDWQSVRAADVTEGSRQGVWPTYELRTRTGRRVRATPTHPFLTFSGWAPLSALRPGSRIGVPRRLPIFGTREARACEADVLGLMLSDGTCGQKGCSPLYTSGDPVLREAFARAVSDFGCVPRRHSEYTLRATNTGHRGGIMEKNRLARWLDSMGLAVNSPEKFVPRFVFELRRPLVARFLRALFSGDGGITFTEAAVFLEFCSTSRRLAGAVQHLLLRFGIVSILRSRSTASGREAYVLTITSKNEVKKFAEEIGFIPGCDKQRRLERALEMIDRRPQVKANVDTLPPEAWHLVRHAAHSRGYKLKDAGLIRTQPDQSVSRSAALEVACRVGDERLGEIADSDVLWDTVVDIRFAGIEPVYDVTIPETSNFIANDIFVHNSTYARCGIIVNVTPLEPEWEGIVTLEVSNTTPLPAKIYANEGIAQMLFFQSDEECEVSYADKKGKYQGQQALTLPKL